MNSFLTIACIAFLGNSAFNQFEDYLKWGEELHQIVKITLNAQKNQPIDLELTQHNSSDEEDDIVDPVPTA